MPRHEQTLNLATGWIGKITAKDVARWREGLRKLGPEGVRARLRRTSSFEPDEMVEIGEFMPLPTRQFVEDWLYQEERRAKHVNAFTAVMAFIAALAGVVAAIPILKTWLGH
jgi:hypothetical protein